jgi:hypothetical protein
LLSFRIPLSEEAMETDMELLSSGLKLASFLRPLRTTFDVDGLFEEEWVDVVIPVDMFAGFFRHPSRLQRVWPMLVEKRQ